MNHTGVGAGARSHPAPPPWSEQFEQSAGAVSQLDSRLTAAWTRSSVAVKATRTKVRPASP